MAKSKTDSRLIQYSIEDNIAIIQLNDPPANTYSYAMMQQLDEVILQARMDTNVHVILLRGAGEKFFCAGADIKMLTESTPEFKYYFCLHANETLNRLEQTPKLVIAALNGHCVGGGLEVALAADIRIARRGAGKIGLPEVNLGVLPGTGGTQRLARLIGKSKAIELMVSGRTLDFDQAVPYGLVNEVWAYENFFEKIMEYAVRFTAPNAPVKAIGNIKRAVQSGLEMGFNESLALERELQQELFISEDAKEGLSAYVGKRKAIFKGK